MTWSAYTHDLTGLCEPHFTDKKTEAQVDWSLVQSCTPSRWQSELSPGFPFPSAVLPLEDVESSGHATSGCSIPTFLSPACSELGGGRSSEQA